MKKILVALLLALTASTAFAHGGGGYGDPKKRDKEKVRQDVRNEVVSKGAAKKLYGVK